MFCPLSSRLACCRLKDPACCSLFALLVQRQCRHSGHSSTTYNNSVDSIVEAHPTTNSTFSMLVICKKCIDCIPLRAIGIGAIHFKFPKIIMCFQLNFLHLVHFFFILFSKLWNAKSSKHLALWRMSNFFIVSSFSPFSFFFFGKQFLTIWKLLAYEWLLIVYDSTQGVLTTKPIDSHLPNRWAIVP